VSYTDNVNREQQGRREFSLSLAYDGSVFTIELFGELDLAATQELAATLERAERTPARQIVIDLSGLDYIDSSGLNLLIRATRRSRMNSDRLRLLRGGGQVARTFKLCRLDDRLPFAD
jgi:anti-sigma B factor antagonist